jgi:DNA-directed RNA polymerase subunit RPC12/RpoP
MTEQSAHTTGPKCSECGREPDLGVDEPVTHCEWCGAEYPILGQDAAPENAGEADQDATGRKDS